MSQELLFIIRMHVCMYTYIHACTCFKNSSLCRADILKCFVPISCRSFLATPGPGNFGSIDNSGIPGFSRDVPCFEKSPGVVSWSVSIIP